MVASSSSNAVLLVMKSGMAAVDFGDDGEVHIYT